MKASLILAIALLALSVNAVNTITHNNGKSLLHILEGGFYQDGDANRVYVILFYNPGTGSQALQAKNDEYRQAIKTQILDKFPEFYYTEVDATHQEYAGFVNNVIKVNTEELKHSPSVAIIEYGQGVWIHGPETVARIANYAPAFADKAKQQNV